MLAPRVQALQTDDFEPLKPAPIPDSTFVRPTPAQPVGDPIIRLGQSPTDLSPKLQAFGTDRAPRSARALTEVQAEADAGDTHGLSKEAA